VPISNFFGGLQRFAGQKLGEAQRVYQQADKSLGGWLPGGGTASPVTRAVFPPQPYPSRSKELENITGVKARFIDPQNTPSLVRRIAPMVSSQWGQNDYANPLLSEIGMSEYRGGATPRERRVEFHELGHINPADKQWFSSFGVSGRSMEGLSNKLGNPAPLDVLSGVLMKNADAAEEDRAERFANRYATVGNYSQVPMTKEGTSGYGDSLRSRGSELVESGVERIKDPFGVRSKVQGFVGGILAKPIQAEYEQLNRELAKELQNDSYTVTPKSIEISRRQSELQKKLEALGVNPN
jgi:hypothetical protein